MDTLDGLLVLDKPGGMTSREAVDAAARWFPRRTKIGHTGTLDPLATGVLVLCLGRATRLVEYVQAMGKTYRSVFVLGAASDTDDADGAVTPIEGARDSGIDAIQAALTSFTGTIEQVPPAHSAAKVAGKRAYALARQGEEVALQPRAVTVYGIDVLGYEWPRLEVEVRCGKGTYIRSLARDLGRKLGCGGYVEVLRRTRVGPFTADAAVRLDADRQAARAGLLPLELALAELPRVVLPAGDSRRLLTGQAVGLPQALSAQDGEVAVFDDRGIVGVARVDRPNGEMRPVKMLGERG
jgi:tRNA pseudouridine55 synthase